LNYICPAVLEAVFLHGLKETFLGRLSSRLGSEFSPRMPEPSFWTFALVFSHKQVGRRGPFIKGGNFTEKFLRRANYVFLYISIRVLCYGNDLLGFSSNFLILEFKFPVAVVHK
jgi:hypothetical protein